MSDKDRAVYISIRAEQIKYFQDKNNGHLFKNPYPIETAKQIANNQLNNDLERGELRITLEQLLLEDNDTCIRIIRNNSLKIAKNT